MALAAAGAVLEGLLPLMAGQAAAWTIIALHVLACGLTSAGLMLGLRARSVRLARAWTPLCAVFSLFVPVIGAAGCLIAALFLASRGPAEAGGAADRTPADDAAPLSPLPDEKTVEERFLELADAEPFGDLLGAADAPTALAMIDALAEANEPHLGRMIFRCLDDPRAEVYQYALGKIAALQERFCVRIFQAQEALRLDADNVEAHVELARCYSKYVDSGLLDQTLVDYYVDLAIAQIERTLAREPAALDLRFRLAELFRRRGYLLFARQWYEDILSQYPRNVEAHLGRLDAMLAEGTPDRAALDHGSTFWEALQDARSRADIRPDLPPAVRDLAEFWLTPRPA